MPSPGVNINLYELNVFNPQISEPIIGMVGPATKGPVNEIGEFSQVGNFVDAHGRPPDARYYAPRAGVRYLERGNALKFVRIAGSNIATAYVILKAADGLTDILRFDAISPGTWANDDISVAITHNGTGPDSYNVYVYFLGQLVEQYVGLDNGIVETKINGISPRVTVSVVTGAGSTFPASSVNSVTGALILTGFSGGRDGALASTDSADSSTSGVAGRRFYGRMDASHVSKIWENLLTIGSAEAGKSELYGSLGMAVLPGTFAIRVETALGVYAELADDGDQGVIAGAYAPGAAGLGILAPSGGGHVGFIDYRTGQWGVKLNAATAFLSGSVDAIYVRADTELVGTATAGLGAYGGNLSRGPVAPGYYNANKVVFTIPIDELVGTATGGAGTAASSEATLKTLAGWLVPGTVSLTLSHATLPVPPAIYDDGFGGFRTGPLGAGVPVAGTIDYRTGQWAVNPWDPVGGVIIPAGASVQAEYDFQIFDMGGGPVAGSSGVFVAGEVIHPSDDGVDAVAQSTDTGAQPISGPYPFLPGNLVLTISDVAGSPETYYDDGRGKWLTRPPGDPMAAYSAGVADAVDYTTGAWQITASGSITAGATVTVDYVRSARDQSRRTLRGTGPQLLGDSPLTPLAGSGMDLSAPTSADEYCGPNWLDHTTGAFDFDLNLITSGANQFTVKDNGNISAVYCPASILGYGDGAETVFSGTLEGAPFRRQDGRLQGFQGAQAIAAAAGDGQVCFAEASSDPDDDHWLQNVAVPSDPDNFLQFGTGVTSIQWTAYPNRDESVFVIAEETVMHITCKYPGDIGNERENILDGLYVVVGSDPTVSGTLRARVYFDGTVIESFGQAADLEELVDDINDAENGSNLISAELEDAGSLGLAPDLTADQTCGMAGAFTMADVVGTKVGQVYTGLQLFSNHETVAVDFLSAPGQWHRPVIIGMQTLCEKPGRRCIGIFSMPDTVDPYDHRDFLNGLWNSSSPSGPAVPDSVVPYPPLSEINSTLMTHIEPWVRYYDQFTEEEVFEPADADMMRLLATTSNPWDAIAGFNRGQVIATGIRYEVEREDRDLMMGLVGNRVECVNPIIRKQGRGLFLLGQNTCGRTPNSKLNRISVRWTVNLLMNAIDIAAQNFLFEINDDVLWREASMVMEEIIDSIKARRGIQDAWVVIDGTTTTPADQDNLTMRGKLFIKPSTAVETIELDLILTPQGVSFEEAAFIG